MPRTTSPAPLLRPSPGSPRPLGSRRCRSLGVLLLLGVLALAGTAGCSSGGGAPAMDPAEVARLGDEIFRRYACNACHSLKGDRRLPGPDLSGVALRRSPEELKAKVLEPTRDTVQGFQKGIMPRLGEKMKPEEVVVLVQYLSTMRGQ